jgi:hypothetical protein
MSALYDYNFRIWPDGIKWPTESFEESLRDKFDAILHASIGVIEFDLTEDEFNRISGALHAMGFSLQEISRRLHADYEPVPAKSGTKSN